MRQMLVIMTVCFVATATQADAHAFLVKALPAVGSTVEPGVTEFMLDFSEAVELVLSGVDMMSSSGAAVPLSHLGFGDTAHESW